MYITCVGNHELIMLVSIVSCSCDSAVLAAFTSAGHSLLSAHTSDISSPLSPGGGGSVLGIHVVKGAANVSCVLINIGYNSP